jgi:hypothetical protein
MWSCRVGVAIATFLLVVLGGLATVPGWCASNFIRIPLGKGASIEVPRNWVVFSNKKLITLDAFVEAKGYKLTESSLTFAASLYDDKKKTIALINVRFYPDNPITQAEVRQVTSNDLRELDVELKKIISTSLNTMGIRMENWFGTKMQNINGLYVLVHEHQQNNFSGDDLTRVRGIRVLRSPRSFTVTISHREREAVILLPIVEYITKSLRQD